MSFLQNTVLSQLFDQSSDFDCNSSKLSAEKYKDVFVLKLLRGLYLSLLIFGSLFIELLHNSSLLLAFLAVGLFQIAQELSNSRNVATSSLSRMLVDVLILNLLMSREYLASQGVLLFELLALLEVNSLFFP